MANKIGKNDFYAFDRTLSETEGEAKPTENKRVKSFFSNRYAILGIAFSFFCTLILFMTASMQFSGAEVNAFTDAGKIPRAYTALAPRGDITDRNGVVYATSKEVNTLLLAYAGLKKDDLNEMLLELSYRMEDYNATPVAELSDYLTVEPYSFLKDEDAIMLWQVNKNLFGLKEPSPSQVVSYQDEYVKLDPQIFFLYLRRVRFEIDEKYSMEEAYRIAVLRYQIMKDSWAFSDQGKPVMIATDVPQNLIDLLLEQNYKYKGLLSGKEYRRVYSPEAQYASHVIGYVGNISQEEYAYLQNLGYMSNDVVGKAGIEAQMERYLHGMAGEVPYNVLTADEDSWAFLPEQMGVAPVGGTTVRLTLDSELQRITSNALDSFIESKASEGIFAGATVVLDAENGEVLAMASAPSFDPQVFILAMQGDKDAMDMVLEYLSIPSDNEEEEEGPVTESLMPLWNRAIMSHYAPGSTYKMVTAVAALETGVISPERNGYVCMSPIKDEVGGRELFCFEERAHGHGFIDLETALQTSCNIYFARLGIDASISEINKMGQRLGLGEYSGIDLPGETKGIRANPENKRLLRSRQEEKTWNIADTAQSAFGQFDNSYSIIQLARYTAGVTTNQLVTPHVIQEVVSPSGEVQYSPLQITTPIGLSSTTVDLVKRGMVAVSESGTAREKMRDLPFTVASKTGSAQTGRFKEDGKTEIYNGLFVCAAPAENPKIVIATIIENAERGSDTTSIAREILLSYFGYVDPTTTTNISDAPIGDRGN